MTRQHSIYGMTLVQFVFVDEVKSSWRFLAKTLHPYPVGGMPGTAGTDMAMVSAPPSCALCVINRQPPRDIGKVVGFFELEMAARRPQDIR
jgi:hypothetical protein